ncbi:asparagine synthase (glutamine-hydrolyzing) [Pseudoalteromonas piscicida]|uniref:asparagine synthase (glutamine-hydrolyzing) n=1 Tax=Pseudoalteromonas piscicida TaxID=43662 RepID=UPI003C7AF938
MCGIAGIFNPYLPKSESAVKLQRMLDSISHRGPDDNGIWQSEGVNLGHRRLSIIDLSEAGHQPMSCENNRYHIVFNGEIYNFSELKAELPGVEWRGSSDTEVLLAAINHWGIQETLPRLNGMFAFAVWDSHKSELTLARDRFGEKPLYYYSNEQLFAFASEVTAIESLDSINLTINRSAACYQLQSSFIPSPLSIYNEVNKLPPGCFLTFSNDKKLSLGTYWSLDSCISKAKENPFTDTDTAIAALEHEIKKAVKLRMVADVPLGAFLSGGVDSSLIAALMQSQSAVPINTFSIGFNVSGYNEAVFAKEVAEYLGTNHHEQYLSPQDALAIVPKLGSIFDEPFSDASQIPTYLVSAMAKKKVTVCLSGDGGDELFSGYNRYIATMDIWRKIKLFPSRRLFAKIIQSAPAHILDKLFFFLSPLALKYGRAGKIGPKLKKLSSWMEAQNVEELYTLSMTHWKNVHRVVKGATQLEPITSKSACLENIVEKMMYQDTMSYLPGDILTKVDRAAMAVSLEGRIPMLDPNVVETAWRIPIDLKQNGNCGKWVLKQVLYKYLPQSMMERPKMGFGVPIDSWLRGELKEWAQDLLSHSTLSNQGLFDANEINRVLNNHLSGEENNATKLWDVLMFQSWLYASPSRLNRL